MNELIEKLGSAQIEYLNALARKSGEATYRERLKNILFNNCAAIIEELKNYKNTENRMASIAKFGVGAIDVIITERQ